MTKSTYYTEAHADTVVALLAQGKRPATCAEAVGVVRSTLYVWRDENPEFARRWDEAVAMATDRVEEIVYASALDPDKDHGRWWLKYNRPHPYNPDLLLKARILQASLAAQAQGGDGRVTLDPDSFDLKAPNDMLAAPGRGSRVVEGQSVRALPLDGSKPEQVPVVVILPHNGRDALPDAAPSDGSGRRLPLPRQCLAFRDIETGEVVKLTADGKLVPAAAMVDYWTRIQAIRAYAQATGDPDPQPPPRPVIDPDTGSPEYREPDEEPDAEEPDESDSDQPQGC